MNKVYVITRGEYSDYGIERIFSTREAAEKYCAVDKDNYDSPMIEEWDLEDGSDILCPNVYKAIFFMESYHDYEYSIKYSSTPYMLDIQKDRKLTYGVIKGISGYIPIRDRIEDPAQIKKIIADHIAKFKADQADI